MRTCYLHIGAPKAGSSAIQGFLGACRPALKDRGLDAVDFGRGEVVTGAMAFAGALKAERDPDRPETWTWRWLDDHLARTTDDVVVSRESLCNLIGGPRPRAFAEGFFRRHGMRLKLLAYVREHVGYLNAAYAQQAKKLRMTLSFDEWLAPALDSDRFGYWRRFKPLIGDPDAAFRIVSLHRLGEGGLIPDFCAAVDRPDVDAHGFAASLYRNETPGPKAIAAGVLIGRGLAERGVDPDVDQSIQRRFLTAVEARGWNEQPFFGPDDAQARQILDAFAEGDERLAQAAWGISWAEAAPTVRRSRNMFDPAAVSPAEIREVEDLAREVLASARAPTGGWRGALARARQALSPSRAPSAPPGSDVPSSPHPQEPVWLPRSRRSHGGRRSQD